MATLTSEQRIEQMLETIAELVYAAGTWKDKRDTVLAIASRDDKANLEEFAAWFAVTEG